METNLRGYPDEIELKVEDRVDSYSDEESFNTEDQQDVAHCLVDLWPAQFQEIAEGEDFSRQLVPNVIEDYFGPVDDDITFGEIEEKFGGWKQYLDQQTNTLEGVDLPGDMDFTKREAEIYAKGHIDAWKDG